MTTILMIFCLMFLDKEVTDVAQQLAITPKDFWVILVVVDVVGLMLTCGFFSEVFTTIQKRQENKCLTQEQSEGP